MILHDLFSGRIVRTSRAEEIMRNSYQLIAIGVLACAVGMAQETPLSVTLVTPLSTDTNHKGDPVTGRVLTPAQFQGDTVMGHVTESKSGNKIHGEAVLNFNFDTLMHNGTSVPIACSIVSIANSKGQQNMDEEGRIIRKSSNLGKAAAGTGAGALIGGLTHGLKGAAIGAGVGAAASLIVIEVAAQGPKVQLASGSQLGLSVNARGGPALASLPPNTASSTAAEPATAPASVPPPASEPAPAAQAVESPAPQQGNAAGDQPDLKAVKIDFIPGEKTVFLDDFSDTAEDEPPAHWKIRDGRMELRTGGGIRQLTLVCPGKPSLHSDSFVFPKNFTVEIDAAFSTRQPNMVFFAWPKDVDGGEQPAWKIDITADGVTFTGPKDEKIGRWDIKPPALDQPIKVALWVQDGRVRGYVNGERVADVNGMELPPGIKPSDHFTLRERCDGAAGGWVGLRRVRVAESAPDFFSTISSTGKYVTHGIQFDTDSDRLKLESAPMIKSVARGLEKNPNMKLEIDGFTDSTGNAQHNQDLSKRRADAVRNVLISQFGVDAARLTANGFGAAKPVGSNDTAEGRAANRRVEFVKM